MFKNLIKTIKKEKSLSIASKNEGTLKQDEINDLLEVNPSSEINLNWNKSSINLIDYQIAPHQLDSVFYIPNYISQQIQDQVWDNIYKLNRWQNLVHAKRRVQRIGGMVTQQGLNEQEPLPQFLQDLCDNLQNRGVYTQNCGDSLNHALINEYLSGSGIVEHSDGPLYHPFVNIISFGCSTVFKFIFSSNRNNQVSLLVEPGSLLIFTNEAYTQWLHGIDYFAEDSIPFAYSDGKILNLGIQNSFESGLMQIILKVLEQNYDQDQIQFKYNHQMCEIINVQNNLEFNKVLIMKRNTRVSVTLRHTKIAEEKN